MTSFDPDADDPRAPGDAAASCGGSQDATTSVTHRDAPQVATADNDRQQNAGADVDSSREGDPSRQDDQPRVVRRRDPAEMSAEERAFLQRYRADMPPHHDSAWG